MATQESIQNSYLDFVLTHGEQPASVYLFAKQNEMAEEEFYTLFGSFNSIEKKVWTEMALKAINEIKIQEVWAQYSSREKALSFFYSFFELAKSKRSFITYSSRKAGRSFSKPSILEGFKHAFNEFSIEIIQDGIESGELADRRFFADRYKDALWIQFIFVLNFWINDTSAGFEKCDEAIEKGVNVTFDLFQRSPIDALFEYGKFLAQNGNTKERFR